MKLRILTATILTTGLFYWGGPLAAQSGSGVRIVPVSIYGDDDRKDLFETDQVTKKLAESTVALFAGGELFLSPSGSYTINSLSLRDRRNLNSSQSFGDQPSAAFCSGALVSEDTVLTAGHCFRPSPTGAPCSAVKMAFGYAVNGSGRNPTELPASDVYFCRSVTHHRSDPNGPDHALIKLDRKVIGRHPLAISRANVQQGDKLFVIGYPSGLPVKVAKNGRVRRVEAQRGFFVADLDTFGGSSGSPVFNAETLKVEGVLARGGTDYIYASGGAEVADPRSPYLYDPGQTSVVGQDEGRGEDVTLISEIQQYIAPTPMEKFFDEMRRQENIRPRDTVVPAVYIPGDDDPVMQPAIYYPDQDEVPEPVEI